MLSSVRSGGNRLSSFRFGWTCTLLAASLASGACLLPAPSLRAQTPASPQPATQHVAQPVAAPVTPNPILPGDHPDPTIARVGDTYWTTSTSGGWAPEFPLFRSTDLKHWTPAGAVFPHTPAWAVGDFWAPELVIDGPTPRLYYVARKRGGPLCVAVATAPRVDGPWQDHGPIECQPDGSIDPAFIRDDAGKAFLIWKEDGNSIGKPTPLWAQPLTDDGLQLTGQPTELIANDPSTWEGGVVEAPFILRHAGAFFLFYAGNACCGNECRYAEGVARADHLLGPWTKDPANPVIRPNAAWKCPGHGTAVETPLGETYFVYHAYPADGTVYLGRESLLDRITWSPDGWPVVNGGRGPSGGGAGAKHAASFGDTFRETTLDAGWKWPAGHEPGVHVGGGRLTVDAAGDNRTVFLARSLPAATYTARVSVETPASPSTSASPASTTSASAAAVSNPPSATAGLAVIGDAHNRLALLRSPGKLELVRETNGVPSVVWQRVLPANAAAVELGVSSDGQSQARFHYSLDGKHWLDADPPTAAAGTSVAGMPAWDQGLRVGLIVRGEQGTSATFAAFTLGPEKR